MSLTNDQITAKNFKEFYAQIRPYLNGQVPPVFNKFSKSDLYSTDEKIVGRWIDGKPIYQKTINFTTPSSINTDSKILTISNGETVIDFHGTISRNDGGYMYLGSNYPSQGNSLFFTTNDSKIECYFRVSISTDTSRPAVITLQYTKTTDSAVEIGNDTDYSTTEKIVGTWIDGKPVYQCTYDLNGMSVSTNFTDIGVSCADIDTLICGGSFVTEVKSGNNPAQSFPVTLLGYSGSHIVAGIGGGGARNVKYITIRYTKTTD